MEGDINRSHIVTDVKKVHTVSILCLGVANKYSFESIKGELGQKESDPRQRQYI